MPKVPRHLHLFNCFREGMLEFYTPAAQCSVSADFRPFDREARRGRGEEEERYGKDRKNSHISPLQYSLLCVT